MNTLKQAKIGDTVTVVKLHGEGAVKRQYHGYGHNKGNPSSRTVRLHLWAIRLRLP